MMKMDAVISQDTTNGHIINKYNFKVLSSDALSASKPTDDGFVPASAGKEVDTSENLTPKTEEASIEEISKSSKDELIESLLQKTDEMSSNFIKMQMKLESKEDEYKLAIEAAKKEAFEEGREAGVKEAEETLKSEQNALMQQYSKSIETLNTSSKEFVSSIEGIKEELIHAAIDIAKEVILVETSQRGNEIASLLAGELISEIQGSSAVTIKVNPKDKVAVEESLGDLENVKVLSDNAVSNGGVIILSDAGNIDGEIMKRYERVKDAALGK